MLVVYIDEAHAADEWSIQSARYNGDRGPVNIVQSRTLEERREAASAFAHDFGFMQAGVLSVVDNPEGGGRPNGGRFQTAFNPWPVRFFVLQEGKVKFISVPRAGGNSDIEILPFCDALRIAAATPF